jgi:hypothetical protein
MAEGEDLIRLLRGIRDGKVTPEAALERILKAEETAGRSDPQAARRARGS